MKAWSRSVMIALVLVGTASLSPAEEVVVLSGLDETVDWLKAENWWGEEKRGEQLMVPQTLVTAISDRWRKNAQALQVGVKKELFYRFMLPLVVYANTMVLDRRERLHRLKSELAGGAGLPAEEDAWLRHLAKILRITADENADNPLNAAGLNKVIDQALFKLDVIPAGLVLGQAAYESGYGTSRFAVEGNALFGQWTFGDGGLVPEQQRKQLGDHRIASYEWPFDSVRGYFINLNSHPAYEEFRRLRAEQKAAGKPLTSLRLAEGLKSYSEHGQAYVDTLKGIIRVNKLDIADNAVFRDEPLRFVLNAADPKAAEKLRADIEKMRQTGEFAEIVARMRLE